MFSRTAVRSVLVLLAVAAARCAPVHPYRVAAVPTQHIVMVESSGYLMDPTGSVNCQRDRLAIDNAAFIKANPGVIAPPPSYSWEPCNGRFNGLWMRPLPKPRLYVNDVFKHMDAHYGPTEPGKVQKRKIVMIIHGGLNTNHTTIGNAQKLAKRLIDDCYYPIFINWQSNLPRALLEHTTRVRQGNDIGPVLGSPLIAPTLVADLGRGIVRAPVIWAWAIKNDFDRLKGWVKHWRRKEPKMDDTQLKLAELRNARLQCLYDSVSPKDCDAIDIQVGKTKFSTPEHLLNYAKATPTSAIPPQVVIRALGGTVTGPWGYVLWLPLKYLTAPILDGLGSAAWKDMHRHAILGFKNDGTYVKNRRRVEAEPASERGGGGLSLFLKELQKRTTNEKTICTEKRTDNCVEWEINLIGHSMGAIVATHMLRNFDDLEIDNIVFMAAACTVRQYEDNVFAYMKGSAGRNTHMWHLVLNELSEVRDQYFYEVPPSGSLLVWIDSLFTDPHTWRDRTAGRWKNLSQFLDETPPSLRQRLHVRVFDGSDSLELQQPQHHGAFFEFDGNPARKDKRSYEGKFWDPQFWKTDLTDLAAPTLAESPPKQ